MRYITDPAWKKYFRAFAKKKACESNQTTSGITPINDNHDVDVVEYGEEVYHSPQVPRMILGEICYLSWVVTEFSGEFNIFMEKKKGRTSRREFVCAFKWRDTALKYALQLLLTSTGKLTRRGLRADATEQAAVPA